MSQPAVAPAVAVVTRTKDRAVLLSSPLHVVVVSTAGSHVKVPEWEQVLSSGAVCLNMIHAAHALGYRAQWLSGWAAYDASARAVYGIGDGEKVAGFIHIGTNDQPQTDRDRPDVDALTSTWSATS